MARARIVVVEDEKIVALEIIDRLKSIGYEVPGSASTGVDAIQCAEKFQPDLILMDIKLKGNMDGIEAAEQIRMKFGIPVVYLTAYADDDTLQRAKIAEPYGYLLKPFEERELYTNIEMALYRAKMERKVKEHEQHLTTILKSIGDAVIVTDSDGKVTFMNDVAEKILGLKQNDAELKCLNDIFQLESETSGDSIVNPVCQVLQSGKTIESEDHTVLIASDGRRIPVENNASPIRDDREKVSGVVLTFRDVTDRNATETILRESEKKYRTLYNHIPDPVLIFDKGTYRFLDCNEAVHRVYGYSVDELKNMTPFDLHPQEDHDEVKKNIDTSNIDRPHIYRHRKKDGSVMFVEIFSEEIIYQDQPAFIAIVRNITKRKDAEDQLKRRAAQNALLYEVGHRLSAELQLDTLLSETVNAIREAFDFYGVALLLIDEASQELNLLSLARSEADLIPLEEFSLRLGDGIIGDAALKGVTQVSGDVSKDPRYVRMGDEKTQSEMAVPIKSSKKKTIGILDIQRDQLNAFDDADVAAMETLTTQISAAIENANLYEQAQREISERKMAEKAMKASEERFRNAFESAPIGMVLTQLDGINVMVNPAFLNMIGYSRNEFLAMSITDIIHSDDRDASQTLIDALLRDEGDVEKNTFERRYLHKKGKLVWGATSMAVIRDAQDNPINILAEVQDITEQKRVREEITHLKEFNENIVQSMSEGLLLEDEKGMITFVNPATALLLGYNIEELKGKSWREVIPDDQQPIIEAADALRVKGQSSRYEVEMQSKSGRRIPVLVSGSPIVEGSNFSGTIAVFTDISEFKQAENEIEKRQKYLESVLHHTPDAIITLDMQNAILEWNPGAELIFGYTRDEVLGKEIDSLITRTDVKTEASTLTEKVQGGQKLMPVETVRYRKDGTPVNVIVAASPIRIGQVDQGIVAVYTDITAQKETEEELVRSKEVAEDMNKELKLAIERANVLAVEAEIANATKSEFLANMSHEIRTPLNGIIGMTELTLETELSPVQQEFLDAVHNSAELLLTVINDILDFSKIEAGRLDIESLDFNLRNTLDDTVHTFGLRAVEKGLELVSHVFPDVPDDLVGDPNRIMQVVLNLVGNAIKFTEEGEVVIEVQLEEETDHNVLLHFTITDSGIGIPEDKHELIFKAFTQADGSTTRKYGGTGLGLAICSKLIGMMGGKLWLESPAKKRPGAAGGPGSTFHFTMQFGKVTKGDSIDSTTFPNLANLPVLVVDDNETNRRVMTEMLAGWTLKPTAVANGKEGWEEMKRSVEEGRPYVLALLDVNMPEMDGFTLAEYIKNDPETKQTGVFILSSSHRREDAVRCKDLDVACHLHKPIKQSEMFDAIINYLHRENALPENSKDNKEQETSEQHIVDNSSLPLRILLAEDNAINMKLALALLRKKGWDVTGVTDGSQAVKALESENYDLVLMDVQMPEMDGIEATHAIRKKEEETGEHIPIIAMTAHAMKGDREKCLKEGMDDYVSKPMKADLLYSTIEKLMKDRIVVGNTKPNIQIDLSKAMDAVDGDKELLKELVGEFLRDFPRQLGELQGVIQEQNPEQLERKAHSFKGAVSNFGVEAAYSLAYELENLGRQSRMDGAVDVFRKLEEQMHLVRHFFTMPGWDQNL